MISRHGERRPLVIDDKMFEIILLRKEITEANPVIENAENDIE